MIRPFCSDTTKAFRALAVFVVTVAFFFQTMGVCASAILKEGASGEEVKALQRELSAVGFAVPDTGFFGAMTRDALVGFQRAVGLKADGIAGPASRSALSKRIAAQKALSTGVYIVRAADNIRLIAEMLGIDATALAEENRMSVGQPLYIGQALCVPTPHNTARGAELDTLVNNTQPVLCQPKSLGQPRVSLTFDGEPDFLCFERILDVLSRHESVKATFFVSLRAVDECPVLIRRALDSGHRIENHGDSYATGDSFEAHLEKILRCALRIRESFGVATAFYRPQIAPAGLDILGLGAQSGHVIAMWTNLGAPSTTNRLEATKAALCDGAVIRLSLTDPQTPELLDDLLGFLRQQQYRTGFLVSD